SVKNLYEEVMHTALPTLVVAALVRTGDLYRAYGKKVRGMRSPSLQQEIDDAAQAVDQEGTRAYLKAIEAAAERPAAARDPETRRGIERACAGAGNEAAHAAACDRR